jgi:hypothetical protein
LSPSSLAISSSKAPRTASTRGIVTCQHGNGKIHGKPIGNPWKYHENSSLMDIQWEHQLQMGVEPLNLCVILMSL